MIFSHTSKKGFTLVEIMVTITIMAILMSIGLAASARAKANSRDNQRISDIHLLQIKLEEYRNINGQYPPTIQTLVTGGYLPKKPQPPTGTSQTDYSYVGTGITGYQDKCIGYHLGAVLENDNQVLQTDKDDSGNGTKYPVCTPSITAGNGTNFSGVDSLKVFDVLSPDAFTTQ